MSILRPRLGMGVVALLVCSSGVSFGQAGRPNTAVPAPNANVKNPPMTQVAQSSVPTVVYTIDGAQTVPVRSKAGSIRRVKQGDRLETGDVVFAEDNTYVVLQLADGSQVKIGQRTQLEVGQSIGQASNLNLHTGAVRGTTSEHLKDSGDGVRAKVRENLKGKLRMYIRTKSAVMGVRGTEFIASYDSASSVSNFHTLQGTLEIGQSYEGLSAGKLMRVSENKFVKADGTNIYRPQSFEKSNYMQSLGKLQPGLLQGVDTSGEDAKLQLLKFRASGLFAQNATGDSYSGLLSWNPQFKLGRKLGVGLGAGASLLLDTDGTTTFLVIDAAAYVSYRLFKAWEIEAGPGVQFWADKDDSPFIMGAANLSWLPRKGWLPLVDRVVLGFRLVGTQEPTIVLTAGIGVSL